MVYDVFSQPDGTFWLATSEEGARYAPSLWRTPDSVAGFHENVNSITEDDQGRLWFASTNYLLELRENTWKLHPLPIEYTVNVTSPEGLFSLVAEGNDRTEQNTAADPVGASNSTLGIWTS